MLACAVRLFGRVCVYMGGMARLFARLGLHPDEIRFFALFLSPRHACNRSHGQTDRAANDYTGETRVCEGHAAIGGEQVRILKP